MKLITRKNLIIIGLISLIGLTGCSSNDNTTTTNDKSEENITSSNNDTENTNVPNHKIGEKVDLDKNKSVFVSVTNVRKVEKDILENDIKDTYAIEIEIINNSENDVESNFLDNYILKDSENRICDAILNTIKHELTFDTIRPGDTLKGEIAYELSEGATPKTIEIDLGLDYYTTFDLN